MKPPPLPGARAISLRRAAAANVFLPGAGLFLLGHRRTGAVLAGLFLGSFLAVFGLFVFGYASYFGAAMDPNLLQADKLDRVADGFHLPWLLALAATGMATYVAATVLFIRARARLQEG